MEAEHGGSRQTTLVEIMIQYESESCSFISDFLWPQGYTVHGILQARILEWVAFPFSPLGPGIPISGSTRELDLRPELHRVLHT